MEEYIDILKKTKLFSGVKEADILSLLPCLGARLLVFQKGEAVMRQGQILGDIPLLVKGRLLIQNDDYWGNRSILGSIDVGELFGEAYGSPDNSPVLNDVIAIEESAVIFFDFNRLITSCPSACRYHTAVLRNLFFAVCEKNRKLVQKLRHLSRRTTREKLISYLSEEAKNHQSPDFEIPFNRQQLADYLAVDRSAMSHELCKMRDDGLIEFHKNRFTIT